MVSALNWLVAVTLVATANPVPKPAPPTEFLVNQSSHLGFLDSDGKEKGKTDPPSTNGALSPDGRRLAALEYDHDAKRSFLVIRTREPKGEPVVVPLVFGQPGRSGGLPVWSADGRRVFLGESGVADDGTRGHAYRVYDFASKALTDVKLPDGCSVSGWSVDGKRFLADVRPSAEEVRVAWLNADGTGKPEYVSPAGEIGYGGRLSRDGKWVLYQGGPQPPKGQRGTVRLYAQDLATGKRTTVDEPGHTNGYCWSPDGTRVAYTWQRSLEKPADTPERETLLITADRDGGNRTVVTRRTVEIPENNSGRSGVVTFFWVVDWR